MVRVSKDRNPSQNRKNRQNLRPRRFQILISKFRKPAPHQAPQIHTLINFLSSFPRKAIGLRLAATVQAGLPRPGHLRHPHRDQSSGWHRPRPRRPEPDSGRDRPHDLRLRGEDRRDRGQPVGRAHPLQRTSSPSIRTTSFRRAAVCRSRSVKPLLENSRKVRA